MNVEPKAARAVELEPGLHTVLAVEYRDTVAQVRIRKLDETVSTLVPLVGVEFSYLVEEETDRVCLGHRSVDLPGQPYVDCQKPIDVAGQAKCRRCGAVDARVAANLHHAHRIPRGQLDRAVAGHLEQANWLYLAGFRDGSIKIGTSSAGRRVTRLSEQGAWRANLVARADDGIAVRIAEDLVTAELGIPQSVSIGRKARGLAQPVDDNELQAQLDDLADQVTMVVASVAGVHPQRERWAYAGVDRPIWANVSQYPLVLGTGAHQFVVADVCGRLGALERGSDAGMDRFVANLGQLYGRVLNVGDHTPDDVLVQDSLF